MMKGIRNTCSEIHLPESPGTDSSRAEDNCRSKCTLGAGTTCMCVGAQVPECGSFVITGCVAYGLVLSTYCTHSAVTGCNWW